MNRIVLIGASALLGLAAGIGFRAWRQPYGADTNSDPPSRVVPSIPDAPPKLPLARSSALIDQTQANLSLTDGVTRWLHWMTAVEKAGPADFPGLARLAHGLPGALKMLAARWIDRDPRGMFDACRQGGAGFPSNELAQLLFETWPKNDPDAVLAALQEHRNLSNGWQLTALNTLFQSRPEQALIAMSQLGIDSYGPNMEGIAGWAAANPRHAAVIALAHPAGYASRLVLETVGKEWAKIDPAAALAFAMEQKTYPADDLANHVLRQWVEKNLDKASEWFAAADERSKEKLLPAFIEAWGKSDASHALHWCLENTAGSRQADVVQSLVKGVLARDVAAAASLVAGMDASPSRTKAAAAFAREAVSNGWFPGRIATNAPRSAKPEAVAWLNELDHESRKEVLAQISWSWSEGAPRDFAAFLQSEAGKDAPPHVFAAASRALVRENPEEAMAWATQAPEALRAQTLTETFQHWTRSQPEAALTWLHNVPAQDPRRETFYLGAVESLVPHSAFNSPSAAVQEAPDELKRRLARELATNPASARQTLEQMTLTSTERHKLVQGLRLEPY
ncbi:MAG: hypothetical protein ACKV19_17695 [Verrucomicrobiales bacterium]